MGGYALGKGEIRAGAGDRYSGYHQREPFLNPSEITEPRTCLKTRYGLFRSCVVEAKAPLQTYHRIIVLIS